MPLHLITPFDRDPAPAPDPAPCFTAGLAQNPRRRWWGMAADCCYLVIEAGAYLLSCWTMALGCPLALLLLLTGGSTDMVFVFLGDLFGHFAETPQGLRTPFARDAAYCLIGLSTVIAAWRLPRFLERVTTTLGDKVPAQ